MNIIKTRDFLSSGTKTELLHFFWIFTDWCNYSCSYCSVANKMREDFSKSESPSSYKLVINRLKNVKVPFNMELAGGEPTLHPNILEVMAELRSLEYCNTIEIITNLSRSVDFFMQFDTKELGYKSSILASFHPEYCDEKFLDKVNTLSKQVRYIYFQLSINLSPKKQDWPLVIKVIKFCIANDINYKFNFLHSTADYTAEFSEEFFKVFSPYIDTREEEDPEYIFRLRDGTTEFYNKGGVMENKYNRFKGYKCTPLMFDITNKGEIRNCCDYKLLPLVLTKDSLIKEITCKFDECACDTMFEFYKEKV